MDPKVYDYVQGHTAGLQSSDNGFRRLYDSGYI